MVTPLPDASAPSLSQVQACAFILLYNVLQETLKSVIAQYNASQLLTMREVRRPARSLLS